MADWEGSYFVDLGTGRTEDGRVSKAPRGRLQRMDGLRGDIAPFKKTTANITVFYSYMERSILDKAVSFSVDYRNVRDLDPIDADIDRVVSSFRSRFIPVARRWRVILQNEKRKKDSGEANNYKNLERQCYQELETTAKAVGQQARSNYTSFKPYPKSNILKFLEFLQLYYNLCP